MTPTGLITAPQGRSRPKISQIAVGGVSQFIPGLLIAIAIVAIYFPVHHQPFFLDDTIYVTNNAHVRTGLNWNTLKWAVTSRKGGEWHPVTWLSHALDCQMFGVNSAWHHDMNVLFHALNALVLFWVLRRATHSAGCSFVVAAMFAVHPMNVEPVVWVAERKTLLGTLFFLLALDAYRCYVRQPREARHWLVAVLFALGLMCKPQVIMLPFILLLWDYWPLGRILAGEQHFPAGTTSRIAEAKTFFTLVKDKLFLFALAVVDALFTMAPGRVSGHPAPHAPPANPLSIRIGNAIVSYAQYTGKAFWPFGLAPTYPYPQSLPVWKVCAAAALLLTISVVVAANWRRRYLLVGWLWFLVTLIPMIGVVEGPAYMADRYVYISLVGLFIMASWGVADLGHRALQSRTAAPIADFEEPISARGPGVTTRQQHRDILLATVSAAVLLPLTVIAHHQVGYWEDATTIWSHNLQVTPDNWYAESELGIALEFQDKPTEAIQYLRRGLAGNPDYFNTNVALGFWEQQHGNMPAAIEYYNKALSLAADNDAETKIRVEVNLGYVYRSLGDVVSANKYFAKAADERQQQERQ